MYFEGSEVVSWNIKYYCGIITLRWTYLCMTLYSHPLSTSVGMWAVDDYQKCQGLTIDVVRYSYSSTRSMVTSSVFGCNYVIISISVLSWYMWMNIIYIPRTLNMTKTRPNICLYVIGYNLCHLETTPRSKKYDQNKAKHMSICYRL